MPINIQSREGPINLRNPSILRTICCSAFNCDPFDQVKSKSYRANRRPIHTPINTSI